MINLPLDFKNGHKVSLTNILCTNEVIWKNVKYFLEWFKKCFENGCEPDISSLKTDVGSGILGIFTLPPLQHSPGASATHFFAFS